MEEQNHVETPNVKNSVNNQNGDSHSTVKHKEKTHSSSQNSTPKSSSSKDGTPRSSSEKPKVKYGPDGTKYIKKDGVYVKYRPSSSSKDGYIKKPDGTVVKVKSKDHTSDKHNSSSKDGKPKDPSSKEHSVKHKDGSHRPSDPNKAKDPNQKSKDSSSKPKDPSLKPKDPNKVKMSSSSSSHSSSPKVDGSKVKNSSGEVKKVSSSSHGEHRKVSSSGEIKKVSSSGDHKRVSSSEEIKKVSSSGEHRKSSSGENKKHSTSDGEHRKSSSTGEVKKVSSSGSKEKRPDGDVKRESDVSRKEHKHTSEHKVKVKTEEGVKVKKEPGQEKVKSPSPVKAVKQEPVDETDYESKHSLKRSIDEDFDEKPKVKVPKKEKNEEKPHKRKKEEEEDDYEPKAKKTKSDEKKKKKKDKKDKTDKKDKEKDKTDAKGGKGKKKKEQEQEVWKWWEEEPLPEGIKWRFLEHKGPVFAPPYEPLPKSVKFYYNGEVVELSEEAEEVAGFYARMLDHEYTTKEVFNKNFFKDWRKVMTKEEKEIITDLRKCNFKEMHAHFLTEAEKRKNRTKEEKQELKRKNEEIAQEYGFCTIDGHKEKIGNFRIEPPGLFRGRGDHPKQGMLKKRIMPEQVLINCSKDAKVPDPPEGHKWGKVIHDNKVTWLASWTENIQGASKYVMLNPSSRLKGEKDWAKYETARKLKKCVQRIRDDYMQDWKSKEMRIRQRAVALYFIDKLALRAGNEKDEETADTVGCCSLRVEHITLQEEKNGKEYVVDFDFLGKDSIRYLNSVPVEKRVFKNLQLFVENKSGEDDLFDRLNTSILNKYLQDLMEGLTAKVFRTYNASITLQNQLKELTDPDDSIPSKMLSYNRANRAVAVLCNHQRAAPKTFDKQMENLQEKIKQKMKAIKDAKADYKAVKQEAKRSGSEKMRPLLERKKKAVERLEDQLAKLEMKATDKEENKEIALGTSKLNYLDPRISVAWCKKWEVPIEKIYNRTQRDKFRWAIDMADEDYEF